MLKTKFFTIPRLSILIFLLPVLAAMSTGQTATGWKQFEPQSKSFTILMPTEPSKIVIPGGSDPGKDLVMYISSEDDFTYSVVTTTSVSTVDWTLRSSRDNFLAGMSDSACASNRAANNTCEVVMVADLEYGRSPARDFRVVVNGEDVGTGRAVFAGSKVFTLMVSGFGVSANQANSKKFIDSFAPAG